MIEELTEIPNEHATMLKEFSGDPATVAELSGVVNNRNLVLARQAQAAVARIESSFLGRASVLDVEYTAVGSALAASFQFDEATAFYQEAARRATDPASAASALRMSAGDAVLRQDVDSMRENMEKARAIFDDPRFQSAPSVTQDVTNATTELQWAFAELTMGNCQYAKMHMANAEPLIAKIPQSPIRGQLEQLWIQQIELLDSCIEIPS